MDEQRVIDLNDLVNLTPEQIVELMDASWPYPFNYIQDWLEDFWNTILGWFHEVVSWITDALRPIFQTVWYWMKAFFDGLRQWAEPFFTKIWDWVYNAVGQVYAWIRDGVAVVWDWVYNAVGQVYAWIRDGVAVVWSWITEAVSGLWSLIQTAFDAIWDQIKGIYDAVASKVAEVYNWFSNNFIDPFIDWLIKLPENFMKALSDTILLMIKPLLLAVQDFIMPLIKWLAQTVTDILQPIFDVLGDILGTLMKVILIIAEPVLKLIEELLTPAFMTIFNWFESLGPVAPQSGKGIASGISSLIAVTLAGLGAMTIAGETLGFWKHIGLGHLSAIIYDVTNYKLLTAAFVGVFAGIYIKTPLNYYYNKIARPNLPNERSLMQLKREYVISDAEFIEGMQYEGYSDNIIEKLKHLTGTPLVPRMLNYLAAAGIADDELIDRELKHAGYEEKTIPYIKLWIQRTASGEVKTLSVSTAMSRYREGFDNEDQLRQNLTGLGVAPMNLDRYVFATKLMEHYDFQHDLAAYYIDAYHRRDIDEKELRRDLTSIGITADRLELIVQAQAIKRLAAPKATEDPALAIEFDTVRDQRKKQLITHDQEVVQLVKLGKEISYAEAIAANDDTALLATGAKLPAMTLLPYETDEGKINIDTIRRQRRQGSISDVDEMASLKALKMPDSLAKAIVDNDALRIKKGSASE